MRKETMKTLFYLIFASLLPVSIWSATISGIVGNPAPGTPVAGVKVVLIEGTSTGQHLDSINTDGAGNFSFSTVGTGTKTLIASRPGYNGGAALVGVSNFNASYSANISITINNSTSTVQGFVKRASDSSVVAGATVRLTPNNVTADPAPIYTTQTDSNGKYHFDSLFTGWSCFITASLPGYLESSLSNVLTVWNSTTTAGTMYLTRNIGSISGTIRRNDSATVVIAGAKVVFLVGTAKVDSATTDTNGNYSKVLGAATYNIRVSAAGMKSDRGYPSKDTTATVNFGSNTVMNTGLTPALSTIGGTIHATNATGGPIVSGAKVVLQHRMRSIPAAQAVWYSLDSTTTDANGIFSFSNLISAPAPASATYGSYRVLVTATGYRNYPNTTAENNADVYQVAYGATYIVNPNIAMTIGCLSLPVDCMEIFSNSQERLQNIRFSLMSDQLILNLNSSSVVRTLEIFDLKGVLQRSVQIPANESRIILPASFAPEKGFLYGLK